MAHRDRHPISELRALAAAKRHFFGFYAVRTATHADSAAEHAFMETGKPIAVMHAGERLEVRAWGSGPTVLLVHGLYLSGGKFWKLVPVLVDAGLRAVAFDAPGHGASAGDFVDADDAAEAIFAVRQAIGPCSRMVAHSMGASWALRALQFGLDVPSVVCIGAPVTVDPIGYYIARHELDAAVASHFRRLLSPFLHMMSPPTAIAAELDALALIVHDRDDPLAPFEGAEALAAAWRCSRCLWTSQLGHFKTLAAPSVLAAIAAFLCEGQ